MAKYCVINTECDDDGITFCQCLLFLHLASQRVHRATDCAHGVATDALHDGVAVPELVRRVVSTIVTSDTWSPKSINMPQHRMTL